MTQTLPTPTARQIADQFKTVIRSWLTSDQLIEVDRRNGVRADATCATHDFCDANMALLEALAHFGMTEDEACDRLTQEVKGDDLLTNTNDGWTLAKVEGFHPSNS